MNAPTKNRGGARKGAGRKAGSSVRAGFKIDPVILKRLRAEIAPGKMSAFVEDAIRDALNARPIAGYQSPALDQPRRP